ncbi:MAG TPA: non-homologous end-joining DNA ligase [Longimicrobiales bacterium]
MSPARPDVGGFGIELPRDQKNVTLRTKVGEVQLTNLDKPFWPELGITKGDLLQYYADVAPLLLPHLTERPMVMKRYPHGWNGDFFFMKRTPDYAPDFIRTCRVHHDSGNVIDFPLVNDVATLLWVINLGCIDLNPWYSRCDDTDRPDVLHFDMDPVPGADFTKVRQAALIVAEALDALGMTSFPKTTGSKGIHIYVPIVRGPTQKDVWTFAKSLAQILDQRRPDVVTAQYRKAKRPPGRVLVDYNQNAWGQTLAGVYSVRPTPRATVSTPVTWDEVEAGIDIEDFRIDNVRERFAEVGDLWQPLTQQKGRFDLTRVMGDIGRPTSRTSSYPSGAPREPTRRERNAEPAPGKQAARKPTAKKPTSKKPTTKKPTTKKATNAAKKAAAKKPVSTKRSRS